MKKLLFCLLLAFAAPLYAPPNVRADIAANDGRDQYTGNGSTTVFVYNFKILTNTNIAVYVNGVLQTLTTHYTVSGVGNDNGGSVTFVTAPTNGLQVLFLRSQPIEQSSSYQAGAVNAAQIERDFDRQTSVNQQQQEQLDRAIQLDRTTSGVTMTVEPEAGKCFGVNDAGTAVEMRDCEGGGGEGGGSGDIESVSGTAGEITVASGSGPDPVVSIATDLNLSTKVLQAGTPLVFEGATANAFETSLVVTDPTADWTFTLPNANSVAVQPASGAAGEFLTGVSSLGVLSFTAPSFSQILGSVTDAQVPNDITITIPNNTVTATHIDETTAYTWSGAQVFSGTMVTPYGLYAALPTPATGMRFVVTDCSDEDCTTGGGSTVRELRYTGAEWAVFSGSGSSRVPTLDEVFDAGAAGTRGAISGATEPNPILIEGNDPDYAVVLRVNSSNSPEVIGKCAGVIGACDRTFSHNAGKKTEFTDSDGNVEVSYTEDVGFSKLTIDTEASGHELRHNGTSWRSAKAVKSVTFLIGSDAGAALADTDDQATVWRNNIAALTLTEAWCETDGGTAIINFQRDDGSAANVLSSNVSCTTSGVTGTIAAAEDNFAVGDKLDFVMVTAGGVAKRVTVNLKFTVD